MKAGKGKRLWLMPAVLLMGCQATPSRMPEAEPAPAVECRWSVAAADEPPSLLQVVEALERMDFLVRDTDTSLGLVSAERSQRELYHNAVSPRPRLGGFLFGGSGGHISSGVGVGIGFGGGPSYDEATRIERVSVRLADAEVQVSRDIRLFDWRGQQVQSRTASDTDFCQTLRNTLTADGATP